MQTQAEKDGGEGGMQTPAEKDGGTGGLQTPAEKDGGKGGMQTQAEKDRGKGGAETQTTPNLLQISMIVAALFRQIQGNPEFVHFHCPSLCRIDLQHASHLSAVSVKMVCGQNTLNF